MYTGNTLDLSTLVSNAKGTVSFTMKTNGTTSASSLSGTNNKTLTAGAMSADNDNNQSVVVTATDAGSATYNGTSKDITITVKKNANTIAANNQTVYVGSTTALSSLTKNNNGGTLSATLGTDNEGGTKASISGTNFVAGTLAANDDANKTVALTVKSARTTTVAEGTASVTVTVQKYTRALTITAPTANQQIKYNATVTATSSNGGTGGTPGAVTYSSSNTSVFTVSGTTIKAVAGSGTATINASRAGSATVKAATATGVSVTAIKADATMTVSSGTMYTGNTLDLSTLVSNAKGTVSFTMKTNGTTSASSLSGTNNKTLTAGAMSADNDNNQSVVVTATDAGSATYNGTSKDITITVKKNANTIAANNETVYVGSTTALSSLTKNNNGGTLSATLGTDNEGGTKASISNGNFVAGTLSASDDTDKTVTVSITSPRTTTVAQGSAFNVTVTVQKYTRALTITAPTASQTVQYDKTVTATSTNGGSGGTPGTVTFSSSNTSVFTVSGTTIKAVASSGTATINASRAGSATVKAATATGVSISATKQTVNAPTGVTIGTDGKVTWTASSNATGYQISIDNSNWTTATSGIDYNSTITASKGSRTVYVRAVNSNSTNYSTPSSNATKSTTVYSLGITKGTGISSVTGAGNYITGRTVSISETASSGYTASGWTKNSGTAPASTTSATTTVTIGADTTLTANATANVYTITLDQQSATTNGTKTIYEKYATGYYKESACTNQITTSSNAISVPSRTGYTFGGFYTSKNGGGTQYIDANGKLTSSASNTNFSASGTLYAKWTAHTYTIEFNGNGPTGGSTASMSMTYDTAKNLTANGFTKTGYSFANWNTKADGSGTSYSNSVSVNNLTATDNGKVILYAQWNPVSTKLTVNPNGGTWNSKTTNSEFTQNFGTEKVLAAPTRTGYSFTGWSVSGGGYQGQSLHTDGAFASSENGCAVYNNTGNGTVTVTRQAKSSDNPIGNYELKVVTSATATPDYGGFYQNTVSAASQKYIHVFVAKLPAGYNFHEAMNSTGDGRTVTWLTSRAGTGKFTVYAYQVNAGSTGTFSTFGHVYVEKVAGATAPTFYVAYSDVINTTSKKDGTQKYIFGTSAGTVTAQWSINKYYFDVNPDSGIQSFSITGVVDPVTNAGDYYKQNDYGTTGTLSNITAKTGYTYTGYTLSGSMTAASGSSNATPKVTLGAGNGAIALNSRAHTYTVEYYDGTSKKGSSSHTYNTAKALNTASSMSMSKSGWTFDGWTTSTSATSRTYTDGQSVNNLTATDGGTITLYAIWHRTATFYSGSSNGTTKTSTQYYNSKGAYSVTKPTAATISGWTAAGWRTDTTATSASYNTNTSTAITASNNTYYAVYTRTLTLSYTIDADTTRTTSDQKTQYYNSGGAATNTSNPSFTLLAAPSDTKSGYAFSKWALGSASGTQYAAGASYTWNPSATDTTTTKNFYSVWRLPTAAEVEYTPADSNFKKNNTTVTNVQDAITVLYSLLN